MVLDRREGVITGGVIHNRIVPAREVRLVRDEIWKGIPSVFGGDDSRSVCAHAGRRRGARAEVVAGPRKLGTCGERWLAIEGRVGLVVERGSTRVRSSNEEWQRKRVQHCDIPTFDGG